MFIKQLQVKNFKCFRDITFENLAIPNGDKGSGLNILIGENGNGKTTFLESINYLTLNSYSIENKLSINDLNENEFEKFGVLFDKIREIKLLKKAIRNAGESDNMKIYFHTGQSCIINRQINIEKQLDGDSP